MDGTMQGQRVHLHIFPPSVPAPVAIGRRNMTLIHALFLSLCLQAHGGHHGVP